MQRDYAGADRRRAQHLVAIDGEGQLQRCGDDIGAGAGRVELHWPLTHSRELASWLREFTR